MSAGELYGIRRDELADLARRADQCVDCLPGAAARIFADLAHACRVAELLIASKGEPAGATITTDSDVVRAVKRHIARTRRNDV